MQQSMSRILNMLQKSLNDQKMKKVMTMKKLQWSPSRQNKGFASQTDTMIHSHAMPLWLEMLKAIHCRVIKEILYVIIWWGYVIAMHFAYWLQNQVAVFYSFVIWCSRDPRDLHKKLLNDVDKLPWRQI